MKNIKCGFDQVIITPTNAGTYMDGYGNRLSPAQGVMYDLYAKTAVFQNDTDVFAIISLDVCGLDQKIYKILCDHIEAYTNISRENFAICATHTHSGPASNVIHDIPIDLDYWYIVGEKCAKSISKCINSLEECTISSGISNKEFKSTVNRRGRPFNDKRIKACYFKNKAGEIKGVISSANCHPVINGSLDFSGDYPSVMTENSNNKYGVPFLFLQGRGADINPDITPDATMAENIKLLGNQLTEGVFDIVENTVSKAFSGEIKSLYEITAIPVKQLESADKIKSDINTLLREYHCQENEMQKHFDLHELEWYRLMYNYAEKGGEVDFSVPLQVAKVGGLIFMFLPFELLTNTGNKLEEYLIEQGYAPENIFIISYSNSTNSYLPPTEEFEFGGYEVGGCRGGASRWYRLPEYCEQTEPSVIEKLKELHSRL